MILWLQFILIFLNGITFGTMALLHITGMNHLSTDKPVGYKNNFKTEILSMMLMKKTISI